MKYWIITGCLFISSEILATENNNVALSLALIERNIFQSTDYQGKNNYLFEKSDLEVQNDKAGEAVRTLARIDTSHFSPAENSFYYYQLSLARVLSGQFDQALSDLGKVKPETDSMENEIRFLTVFILNEMENFQDCKAALIEDSAFLKCTINSPSSLPSEFDRKDPEKATRLSAIFPGAGLIYDGKWGKGLLSFALTAGFVTFGVYNFTSGYYAMAVVSGLFPALKFYSGGKRLSEKLAEKQNLKKIMELKLLYRSQIYSLRHCK